MFQFWSKIRTNYFFLHQIVNKMACISYLLQSLKNTNLMNVLQIGATAMIFIEENLEDWKNGLIFAAIFT